MVSCCTDLKEYICEYQWTIKKFSVHLACSESLKTKRSELTSSSFLIGNTTKWHLKLYFYGNEHENKDYIGLFTCYDSANEIPITWSLSREYFIIGATKRRIKLRSSPITKFDAATNNSGLHKMFKKKQLIENANLYLPNDELTIISRMIVIGQPTTIVTSRLIPKITNKNHPDNFIDMEFILDDKQRIPAHKMMLMARSPVFASMFGDKMKEKTENKVKIDNINSKIFKEVLRYIYTDQVYDLDNKAMDLMIAADKFGLEGLKEICANFLCNNITVDSVIKIFLFAQHHNNQRLLDYSREFINKKIKCDNNMLFTTTTSDSTIMKPN